MAVTALMVKELRERTGAGMLDCKKALEETNGDIAAAIDYLREKGIAKAAKKADRIAAEGLTNVVVKGDVAYVYEVNSETDFVAKNNQFLELVDLIGEILLESNAKTDEEALELVKNGKPVSVILAEVTATIGEKITLRRVTRVEKKPSQGFGYYRHMGGKISVLTILAKDDFAVAKDIAMHVAANNPKFLNRSAVDQKTLEHEKHILTEQALAEGKPANIVEKMIVGRLNKFLQDICLIDQAFVKNPDETVAVFLKSKSNDVVSYLRLEVGEGVEKKVEDFAAEVAAQIKK